ncbi:MAG: hypothetical protein OHK0021_08780 [Bryobacter sp.]
MARDNKIVQNRRIFLFATASSLALGQGESVIKGRLQKGRQLRTADGTVTLEADESIGALLDDERVIGMELEIEGQSKTANQFAVNPVHRKPVYTYADGRRLLVSYWCDVCYIRFYRPGTCWCCQKEVLLDPKDPTTPERVP